DLVTLRVAVPRVRGALPAVAAPQTRRAHTSLAAAATSRRPTRGRVEAPELPRAARDDARVPARRVRRACSALGAERSALAEDPDGVGRDSEGLAVRAVTPLWMDRRVHV